MNSLYSKLLSLNLFILFCLAVTSAYAQPSIQGMFAYNDVNGKTPLDSVQACDSVYFAVAIQGTPSTTYGILVDDNYYESYTYSMMQEYPTAAVSTYKVFFKIPCNYTAHTTHLWAIGTANDYGYLVYAAAPITAIIQAYQQNKKGTVSIYNVQGVFVKTSSVQDFQKGLQSGVVYLYQAIYSDNTFDSGKIIIE